VEIPQEANHEHRQGASESGDEILGTSISAEQQMRYIKTVDAIFGKGAPHQDLNLLRILHAGILHAVMLSPRRSEFSLGNTGHEVRIDVNGKRLTIAANGQVSEQPQAAPATAAAPSIEPQSQQFQPGEMVTGKGIFIGEFDLFGADGRSLGIRTRWYDAAVELGKPMTFDDTAKAVAAYNDNGRGGLRLDPVRYEAELFEKLRSAEALGKNVIAPLEVVNAIYALRNRGDYKRLSDCDLPGKLLTIAGTDLAHWQWSCKPDGPDGVRAVDFTDGHDDWGYRVNSRLSGRVCFAELVL
jgi:hypothetical protein